jgi:uncharacterized iron-regulated membrane protein
VLAIAVNPYTAEVIQSNDKAAAWRTWAEQVHGTLLIGTLGDRLIEAAA